MGIFDRAEDLQSDRGDPGPDRLAEQDGDRLDSAAGDTPLAPGKSAPDPQPGDRGRSAPIARPEAHP